MKLKKITSKNIWNIIALSVNDNQASFVASNTESILEAYTTITSGGKALPFGIYEEDTLIGFVMFGYDSLDENDPKVAAHNYCLWRFMIDKSFQGKGYGKRAMREIIRYLETKPCGPANLCWLSYEPENSSAKALYQSFGFEETGEICAGEIVAARKF